MLKDITCHPCALTDLPVLYMLRTHHGLPHHERGKHAAPLTTTHSRTRVPPPEPRGEAAGGVCAPGFCGFCGLRDSGGRRVSGFRRVFADSRASARSRGSSRVARATAGMALLRSLSPEVLGTRVVLFIEVVLFHTRAGRAQAHDRPVLYTRIVQSSLRHSGGAPTSAAVYRQHASRAAASRPAYWHAMRTLEPRKEAAAESTASAGRTSALAAETLGRPS